MNSYISLCEFFCADGKYGLEYFICIAKVKDKAKVLLCSTSYRRPQFFYFRFTISGYFVWFYSLPHFPSFLLHSDPRDVLVVRHNCVNPGQVFLGAYHAWERDAPFHVRHERTFAVTTTRVDAALEVASAKTYHSFWLNRQILTTQIFLKLLAESNLLIRREQKSTPYNKSTDWQCGR